jgi:hypothetical protein
MHYLIRKAFLAALMLSDAAGTVLKEQSSSEACFCGLLIIVLPYGQPK